MNKSVWGLFVADSQRSFPNFFPIGIYSSEDKARGALFALPKEESYQLFELPVNIFFGTVQDAKVISEMGRLYHEHFEGEE